MGAPVSRGFRDRALGGAVLVLLLGAAGCSSPPRQHGDSANAPVLSDSALGELAYRSSTFTDRTITLHDGEWDGDSALIGRESAALRLTARGHLLDAQPPHAVVVLFVDPGATGRFFDLVPIRTTAEGPRVGRPTVLGDRVRPESLWIAGARAHLRLVVHDTTDGLCCPTRRELRRYRLVDDDSLALEHLELVERISSDAGS